MKPTERDYFILGYDFGGTKVAVAAATRDGRVLESIRLNSRQYESGHALLEAALDVGERLADGAGNQTGLELAGIGVSSMGITYPDRVEMAPNIPGWTGLRMESMYRSRFGSIPIMIENDVKTAAMAEVALGSLAGVDVGMYVNLGTGVAVALTLQSRVIRGSHGAAGEIAYCRNSRSDTLGYADGAAPFEEYAGGMGLERRAAERFGRSLTARDLFGLAAQESDVREFMEQTLDTIAFQISNAVILWDPSRVVVGGGMTGAKSILFPYLSKHFEKYVPCPPEIMEAHFKDEAGLYGAIQLVRGQLSGAVGCA